MHLIELIPTLQLAVGPVILISGVGLLMLSMTNRFGRVIDRSRLLTDELEELPDDGDRKRKVVLGQLRILAKRARILRAEIALAASSVLLAALLIIALFVGTLFHLEIAAEIAALFSLCLACLISSLVLFMVDINLSLTALWLEMPAEALAKYSERMEALEPDAQGA